LASATGDTSSQKSATYQLITKYTGVSTDTVDLLADRMRARGAYDAEYVANKSAELGEMLPLPLPLPLILTLTLALNITPTLSMPLTQV